MTTLNRLNGSLYWRVIVGNLWKCLNGTKGTDSRDRFHLVHCSQENRRYEDGESNEKGKDHAFQSNTHIVFSTKQMHRIQRYTPLNRFTQQNEQGSLQSELGVSSLLFRLLETSYHHCNLDSTIRNALNNLSSQKFRTGLCFFIRSIQPQKPNASYLQLQPEPRSKEIMTRLVRILA